MLASNKARLVTGHAALPISRDRRSHKLGTFYSQSPNDPSAYRLVINVSPSTIDMETLLGPISDDCPGGDPFAYTRELRAKINELRYPPRSSNPDDPDHDGGADSIDWNEILELSSYGLTHTAKDLRLACHLTEAALNRFGIPGLRDGLVLLYELSERYWDTLAPRLEPDDPDTRCSPLENLLDDPTHGPRLPTALRSLPLIQCGSLALSLNSAMRQSGDDTAIDIASAMKQIPVEVACRQSDELSETIIALDMFQQLVIERLGEYAPAFTHLKESLELIRRWFDVAFKTQLEARTASRSDNTPVGSETNEPAASLTTPDRSAKSRSALVEQSIDLRVQAYQQLSDAANVLQRLEPHSPIPYMVHRAVQLGRMPFHKLMIELVKEESVLEMFSRELGLPSIASTVSSPDE